MNALSQFAAPFRNLRGHALLLELDGETLLVLTGLTRLAIFLFGYGAQVVRQTEILSPDQVSTEMLEQAAARSAVRGWKKTRPGSSYTCENSNEKLIPKLSDLVTIGSTL